MTASAQQERDGLCDLFLDVGPDAATLCTGWTTRDLAAHVVLRESHPVAAAGIVLPPLAGWTGRVQRRLGTATWPRLVQRVRNGPRPVAALRVGPVDDWVNGIELLVHHEDVRRAQPAWRPRELPPTTSDAAWRTARRLAQLRRRHWAVPVRLRSADGRSVDVGAPDITVVGEPVELLLVVFGRGAHAQVSVEGAPDAVATFSAAHLR